MMAPASPPAILARMCRNLEQNYENARAYGNLRDVQAPERTAHCAALTAEYVHEALTGIIASVQR